MDVSVIIPTYNRPDDLSDAIQSILIQSVIPKEIIVVDSAINLATENIIRGFKSTECRVNFLYLQNPIDSSAVARNIGSKISSGDILLFLDDDVVLEKNYIKEILKIYYEYPICLVAQGNVISSSKEISKNKKLWNKFWNLYCKFFCLVHGTANEMRVLKSGQNTTPPSPSKIINCQWASGCNFSIRKEIFEKYQFDDKLIKYSYGEDKDLSYRIFKDNKKSILLTPEAKLVHKGSFNKSSPVKKAIIMEKAYSLYFVSKNLGRPINYLYFLWSEVGSLIRNIVYLILFFRKKGKYFILKIGYDMYAYYVCFINFPKIKDLNIEYINNKYLL